MARVKLRSSRLVCRSWLCLSLVAQRQNAKPPASVVPFGPLDGRMNLPRRLTRDLNVGLRDIACIYPYSRTCVTRSLSCSDAPCTTECGSLRAIAPQSGITRHMHGHSIACCDTRIEIPSVQRARSDLAGTLTCRVRDARCQRRGILAPAADH